MGYRRCTSDYRLGAYELARCRSLPADRRSGKRAGANGGPMAELERLALQPGKLHWSAVSPGEEPTQIVLQSPLPAAGRCSDRGLGGGLCPRRGDPARGTLIDPPKRARAARPGSSGKSGGPLMLRAKETNRPIGCKCAASSFARPRPSPQVAIDSKRPGIRDY